MTQLYSHSTFNSIMWNMISHKYYFWKVQYNFPSSCFVLDYIWRSATLMDSFHGWLGSFFKQDFVMTVPPSRIHVWQHQIKRFTAAIILLVLSPTKPASLAQGPAQCHVRSFRGTNIGGRKHGVHTHWCIIARKLCIYNVWIGLMTVVVCSIAKLSPEYPIGLILYMYLPEIGLKVKVLAPRCC